MQDEASRIWESVDREGAGFLHYPQVAAFFKQVDRRMTHEELTHLLSLVHSLDHDHRGHITFQDMLRAVRAVELQSPRGQHARGFRAGPAAGSGGAQRPQRDDYEPWVMEAYAGAGRGNEYLLDAEAGGWDREGHQG